MMEMDAPVLLTGASGFIGGALALRLLDEDADVFCLVRTVELEAVRKRGIPKDRVIEISSFKHSELGPLVESIQPEYVLHLAACGVNPQFSDPEEILSGNVDLVTQLLLAVRDCPVKRFIHTGSCFEYAVHACEERLTEESPIAPDSLYGAAKAASVLYGNALAGKLKIPFTVLRLFGVFGPGEAPERLLPYLIERLMRDRPVDLTEGEQIRDLLFIDDVVEAYLTALLSSKLASRRAYNVCSGDGTRIKDLALAVARVLGKPSELLEFGKRPYRPDECMQILGNNQRFLQDTGWEPRTSLEDGIIRMVEDRRKAACLNRSR